MLTKFHVSREHLSLGAICAHHVKATRDEGRDFCCGAIAVLLQSVP